MCVLINVSFFGIIIDHNCLLYFCTDVPMASMHLGSKMNPNDIEEGDDVYFGCEVDANPPAYKVVWEHNVSKGVVFICDE